MSTQYMLDTDSVSYILRAHGRVAERVFEHAPSALCISAVTLAELRFGADKRGSRKLHKLIDTFVTTVAVMPFGADEAQCYGRLAATLMARGTPIGSIDTMIAAHAMALKLVLVTNNVKHFDRVTGLKCENWV